MTFVAEVGSTELHQLAAVFQSVLTDPFQVPSIQEVETFSKPVAEVPKWVLAASLLVAVEAVLPQDPAV